MPAEASAFSTADESSITCTIYTRSDTTADRLSVDEFDYFYDIRRTADEITHNDFKRVALQFPDELLHDSVPIYRRLRSKLGSGRDLYVLADTSYGSCCADEVAAQHVNADAIVHFGHACMTLTSRLPIVYVFGQKPLDIQRCVSVLVEAYQSHGSDYPSRMALLRHEVGYTHLAGSILTQLRVALEPFNVTIQYVEYASKSVPSTTTSTDSTIISDFSLVFYIGSESLSLTNLLMTHAFCDVSLHPNALCFLKNLLDLSTTRYSRMIHALEPPDWNLIARTKCLCADT
ncbi:Diphthamide biosynthesis protein 2 [Leucoagaricus gongylophorus]